MKILVLSSGAGGGFPQWNCNSANCAGQRQGSIRARERTQSSIAVSGDGQNWVLLNASPDIGEQIRRHPQLHLRHGLRDTPIRAVVLMDAQVDHVTGLLGLREGPCIDLWCTRCVFEDLTSGLPLLNVLQHYCGTRWHMIGVDGDRRSYEFEIEAVPQLRFVLVEDRVAVVDVDEHLAARPGAASRSSRITLAGRDVEHGLEVARRWCVTRERQERALAILDFKLDILWAMLDAIALAYPDDLAKELRP